MVQNEFTEQMLSKDKKYTQNKINKRHYEGVIDFQLLINLRNNR